MALEIAKFTGEETVSINDIIESLNALSTLDRSFTTQAFVSSFPCSKELSSEIIGLSPPSFSNPKLCLIDTLNYILGRNKKGCGPIDVKLNCGEIVNFSLNKK